MRIGINADEANVKNPVGIGQFALNVTLELEKIDKQNKYFLYLTSSKKSSSLPAEREGWCYKHVWPKKFSTQLALPFNLLANREKLDVFFTPTHYAPRFCKIPSVVSVMDTSYLLYPQYFKKSDLWQLTKWTEYSVKNAKKVIAISESTKKDVVKYYGKKPEDIVVCYPGCQKIGGIREIGEIGEIREKYKIQGEYIIAIGTLQPRKNYERLIRVYAKLKQNGIKEKLVIVGKKGWLYESIFKIVEDLKLEHDVIFTGYIGDEEAFCLLQNAKIYVLASLYEGFGISVLEAQAAGVPCVVSRVSSVPEVAGEAALYFNPEDEKEMENTIGELIKNEKMGQNLASKGLENVQKFSWEKCARGVLRTIQEAV